MPMSRYKVSDCARLSCFRPIWQHVWSGNASREAVGHIGFGACIPAIPPVIGTLTYTLTCEAEAGVEPNVWTYNAMMKAHCQANSLGTAFQVRITNSASGHSVI